MPGWPFSAEVLYFKEAHSICEFISKNNVIVSLWQGKGFFLAYLVKIFYLRSIFLPVGLFDLFQNNCFDNEGDESEDELAKEIIVKELFIF